MQNDDLSSSEFDLNIPVWMAEQHMRAKSLEMVLMQIYV